MTKNLRSVVLLCILACIALFLIGFRLGKHVETLDKQYIPPSLTPTPTLSPTPTIALGIPNQVLNDIKDKNCKTTYKLASPEAKVKVRTSTVSIVCTSSTPTLKISSSPSPTSLTTPIPPTL